MFLTSSNLPTLIARIKFILRSNCGSSNIFNASLYVSIFLYSCAISLHVFPSCFLFLLIFYILDSLMIEKGVNSNDKLIDTRYLKPFFLQRGVEMLFAFHLNLSTFL